MDEFIGKDETFVKDWLVRQGLEKPADVLKGLFFNFRYFITSGAIIGDGDRKPWDSRAPMIWDNFSIFRTNCAILTS